MILLSPRGQRLHSQISQMSSYQTLLYLVLAGDEYCLLACSISPYSNPIVVHDRQTLRVFANHT